VQRGQPRVDFSEPRGVEIGPVEVPAKRGDRFVELDLRGIEQFERRLQPFVEDRPHDHLVRKQYPGSFTGTDLEGRLRADGVDTVTVVGYMTQLCVDTIARQAAHRGFTVEVLEDATGTLPLAVRGEPVSASTLHTAVLAGLGSAFASVASTDEWVDAVQAGTPLPPPSLLDAVARGAAQ